MREVRNILIGLELNAQESQLCYFDRKAQEPVSVPTKVGTNVYTFPTRLSKAVEGDDWHYGLEAEYFASRKGELLFPDLLTAARDQERVTVGDQAFETWDLLAHYMAGALKLLGVPDVVRSTLGICLTTPKLTPRLALCLKKALRAIGFSDRQILLSDFKESFYYYCYSQQPAIWTRNMALIRFDGRQVKFDTMSEFKNAHPHVVSMHSVNGVLLPEDEGERDEAFSAFVRKCTGGQLFSGIFITGSGFAQSWASQSIRTLVECGRHVFEGNNLFVKGACWAAAEKFERHQMKGRIYLSDDLVKSSLTLDVIDGGNLKVYPLVEAGKSWFEEDNAVDFILDGRRDIVLTVTSLDGGSRRNEKLDLDGLPERPNRTTRIRLKVECRDPHTCLVSAEDLGFGDLFPASYRVWEKEIDLSDRTPERHGDLKSLIGESLNDDED